MQPKQILGMAAGLAMLAGCSRGGSAKPLDHDDVSRIVERCADTIGGLDSRLASGNGAASYQAAQNAASTCQASDTDLVGADREACRQAVEAGSVFASVTADAIDDGKPSSLARSANARAGYAGQLKACRASLGMNE